MAKKGRLEKTVKAPQGENAQAQQDAPITILGWRLIAGGACAVFVGFLVLSQADPLGRNWAASAAPLLILGGYALIGLGIFAPASEGGGEPGVSPSPTPGPSKP